LENLTAAAEMTLADRLRATIDKIVDNVKPDQIHAPTQMKAVPPT
jgi:hypothetical protein